MKTFRFYKTGKDWYIDLPEFLEQGGSIGDLQMVEGADYMLDLISKGNSSVSLIISDEKFEGSDLLTLVEKCDPIVGGGYYLINKIENLEVNKNVWLCAVTEYVFGNLPEQIFIKRIDVRIESFQDSA